jgi:hypothetical protein
LGSILARARGVYKQGGLGFLIKRGLAFIKIYDRTQYYLCGCNVISRNESDFKPKIKDFEFRMVSSRRELDELIMQGFNIPFDHNNTKHRPEKLERLPGQWFVFPLSRIHAERLLDSGALAFFVFVERELAAMGWLALTRKAQARLPSYPYKVDFSNRQACIEASWTKPKFRRKGFHTYLIYMRQAFLMEKGVILARSLIATDNVASLRAHEKFSPEEKIYGKASYFKIFGIRIWKETALKTPSEELRLPCG